MIPPRPPPPPQPLPAPAPPAWPLPTLRLQIDDLSHPGAGIFLAAVAPLSALRTACTSALALLYPPPPSPAPPPPVKTLTLILRSMPGVAHTTSSATDEEDKEIHYSLEYVHQSRRRAREEILGVLTHEAVHVFQHDAGGTCNAGLIEGVADALNALADYVRLKASLAPPHWPSPRAPPHHESTWDAGYETTGYFLAWLERGLVPVPTPSSPGLAPAVNPAPTHTPSTVSPRPSTVPVPRSPRSADANENQAPVAPAPAPAPTPGGPGTIQRLNALLVHTPYTDAIFEDLTGRSVEDLWDSYCAELEEGLWEVVDEGEGEGEKWGGGQVRKRRGGRGRSMSMGALWGWGQ
ncbi:hypothetical protein DXG01_016003 [Tephrocybe rancida]|nr:hypothetical protein DXG01_016003 [Tephrocybe rancida]